jgi:Tol biopolymer transport system component
MNADGSEQRNLMNYPLADDHGPSWTDGGFGIIFYSNRDGNWDLYLMNAQGGEVTNLTNTPTFEQEPFWRS